MENLYHCPICKEKLVKNEKFFICNNNHSFDIAKQGYVNLLPVNKKNNLEPGDNEIMCQARNNFLQKNYYKNLAEPISKIISENNAKTILDAGCGTGYYSNIIFNNFNADIYGIDISKFAIKKASQNNKNIHYAVASIFDIPLVDNCIDVVLNIFAPKPLMEFDRVLKDNGIIIEVIPGNNHLIELRKLLYSDPTQRNQKDKSFNKNIFQLVNQSKLTYNFEIENNADLINLFYMTPYAYTTKLDKINNLSKVDIHSITADFIINIWKKSKNS